MSPLRDTVSLVNSIEGDVCLFEEFHVLLLGQRFGGDIQQFCLARLHVGFHLVDGRLVQRRVQVVCRSLITHGADDVHLILHQGNQR